MLPYDKMLALSPIETIARYTERQTILYALGLGAGAAAPTDPAELRFVYEADLAALPTMALVIAYPGFYLKEPQYRVDWTKVLHGEQRLTLHRPLPPAGHIRSVLTIDEIYDKGAAKGALLFATRTLTDAQTGEKLATLGSTSFLRGDGGCGGRTDAAPKAPSIPDRAPDLIIDSPTRIDQALLYRLSGDMNPLHADPAVAKSAGFDRPILHGMCTYGIVGRALLRALCGNDSTLFYGFDARFSSPVFPGDTIRTLVWHGKPGQAHVRALALERNLVVLDNGFVTCEASPA